MLKLIFGTATALLVIGIWFRESMLTKKAIASEIKLKGGRPIKIAAYGWGGDDSFSTYEVLFSSDDGELFSTKCQVVNVNPNNYIIWDVDPAKLLTTDA